MVRRGRQSDLLRRSARGLWLILGSVAAVDAGYLFVLAVAAFRYREPSSPSEPTSRLAVLVPAHDEAALIGRCLTSLHEQDYPAGLQEIVVVADNCTDATASLARAAQARVLVRDVADLRGKGYALRWGMDRLLEEDPRLEAVVVVDADSVAETNLLRALAAAMERGADAVQAEYLMLEEDPSPKAELRGAAMLLFHRVRFAGRAALGLPCNLAGNGMLFSRRLLESHPWSAFTSAEDLEFSMHLRTVGVRPVFSGSARLRAPILVSGEGARIQRERWEGGRLHVVRTQLPPMVAAVLRGRLDLLDAAFDLSVPPLGFLALAALGGTALSGLLVIAADASLGLLVPWVVADVALTAFVLTGLKAAGADPSVYRSLLSSPRFIASKALGAAGVIRGSRGDTWMRTERPGEQRDAQVPAPELDDQEPALMHRGMRRSARPSSLLQGLLDLFDVDPYGDLLEVNTSARLRKLATPGYVISKARVVAYERLHPDLPWITRDAIHLLEAFLAPTGKGQRERTALEWGSGRSTSWLAQRCAHLTSIEHGAGWHEAVGRDLHAAGATNVDHRLVAEAAYVEAVATWPDASVDFVLVDGLERLAAFRRSTALLRPGGWIMLDNANWYLPSDSPTPHSRTLSDGPAPGWEETLAAIETWQRIWTTNGVNDTAIFVKPCREPPAKRAHMSAGNSVVTSADGL